MAQLNALVIDDNAQNLRVLNQLLTKNGVQCIGIADPLTLETLLPTLEAVDVVFLDLEMPGLDGYQTKDILRIHLKDTPIIAYTVHVSEVDVARKSGFDGFLAKPLDSTRFAGQLARILRHEPMWDRQ